MPLLRGDIFGSPNIGVYCFSSEAICLVPHGVPERKRNLFSDCLKISVHSTSIAGSVLLGVLIAGNSMGLALPRTVRPRELEEIRSLTDLNLTVLNVKWTALGNLILVNDKGALVDPRLSERTVKTLSDGLGVEVVRGEINGLPYVGSLAAATGRGVITHPEIKDEERRVVEEVLRVPTGTGTINDGVPYPSSGMLANNKGAVVGPLTSGMELATITRIMKL